MKPTQSAKPCSRWLRRLVLVLLVAGIALPALGWWAWTQRVPLVNLLLDRMLVTIAIEVKSIEVDGLELRFGQMRARWRSDSTELASIEQAEWSPQWLGFGEGKLGSISLAGARVDLDVERLRQLSKGAGNTAKRWSMDRFELSETPVTLRDAKGLLFSAKIEPGMEGVVMDGGSPQVQHVRLKARNVVWRDHPLIEELMLKAKTTAQGIEVSDLHVAEASIDSAWFTATSGNSVGDAWPHEISVLSASLQNMRFKAADLAGLNLAFRFSWKGHQLTWRRGDELKIGPHELDMTEIQLRPANGTGEILAAALHLKANGLDEVHGANLIKPRVRWTQAFEDVLLKDSGSSSGLKLQVRSLSLEQGDVAFEMTKKLPLQGKFRISATLRELDSSLHSSEKQQITISDLQMAWKSFQPFGQLKELKAEIVPDALRERFHIDLLHIMEPRMTLNPENGPWFEQIATEVEPTMRAVPFWKRLGFGSLAISAATADVVVPLAHRLEVETAFEVRTTPGGSQQLTIHESRGSIPSRVNMPVASLKAAVVEAELPDMWRDHSVGRIDLSGGHVDVGDALMTLFRGPAQIAEGKAQAVAQRWHAGDVRISDFGVTLEEIAPQVPPLHFTVNLSTKDTPLDLEGLAENVEPQRVTLKNLRIPSPHRPLNAVAEMTEIQVHYTLDGLLHRRIDRVDILAPTLFVGEDLFWYVENYRKSTKGEPELAESFVGPVQEAKHEVPGWRVDTLSVHDGRLAIAPKGVPIRGLGEPFPFSFTTRLESGELQAELQIPQEDRELAEMKLKFTNLRGKVSFNLPMRDRNNNVVEVFQADRIQWKNLHADNTSLSITYDRNGIYGSFYGKAYAGDVNGAFNVYLDDSYTWDGWIAATQIQSGPVTRLLFPEYFTLDGTVTGKIVATGDGDELYQGDAEFLNHGQGRFEIATLNDLIKDLPAPMRGNIADQIRRIGLETLRDFDYESVDGKARFYGREGRGHLRFKGPGGKRTIEINVYDHRLAARKNP
jgi:hypothetical protein